jgi:hypothetical protein
MTKPWEHRKEFDKLEGGVLLDRDNFTGRVCSVYH